MMKSGVTVPVKYEDKHKLIAIQNSDFWINRSLESHFQDLSFSHQPAAIYPWEIWSSAPSGRDTFPVYLQPSSRML